VGGSANCRVRGVLTCLASCNNKAVACAVGCASHQGLSRFAQPPPVGGSFTLGAAARRDAQRHHDEKANPSDRHIACTQICHSILPAHELCTLHHCQALLVRIAARNLVTATGPGNVHVCHLAVLQAGSDAEQRSGRPHGNTPKTISALSRHILLHAHHLSAWRCARWSGARAADL
jgi:hypothetical protein